MPKPKKKPGDYIRSWWMDDHNREEYVFGHVTGDVAHETLGREHLSTAPFRPELPVRHAYMHSGFPSESLRSEGCDRELYIHDEPGRGRHKVTIVKWSDLFPPKQEAVRNGESQNG